MRCDFCKKKCIPLACKWCGNNYCVKCIMLETHECEHLLNCKLESLKNLKTKLEKEKTTDIKLYKI